MRKKCQNFVSGSDRGWALLCYTPTSGALEVSVFRFFSFIKGWEFGVECRWWGEQTASWRLQSWRMWPLCEHLPIPSKNSTDQRVVRPLFLWIWRSGWVWKPASPVEVKIKDRGTWGRWTHTWGLECRPPQASESVSLQEGFCSKCHLSAIYLLITGYKIATTYSPQLLSF